MLGMYIKKLIALPEELVWLLTKSLHYRGGHYYCYCLGKKWVSKTLKMVRVL